jgi:uncharacterized protein with HEPN domain
MTPEVNRRLGHALQAIQSIQKFTGSAPLQQCLSDDLIRDGDCIPINWLATG